MTAKHTLGRQFVDVFHGTLADNAHAIAETHLRPAEGLPDVMTVAYSREQAVHYARDRAAYAEEDGIVEPGETATPAVLHFRVPAEEWHSQYKGHEQELRSGRAAGLARPLPAKYLHKLEEL